jgi:hypothetical protein
MPACPKCGEEMRTLSVPDEIQRDLGAEQALEALRVYVKHRADQDRKCTLMEVPWFRGENYGVCVNTDARS